MSETRADFLTRFKGKGIGIKHNQRPVGVMLPLEIDLIVRSIPNRSQWMREAVIEKLVRDGLLSDQQDAPNSSSK